jgi:hypothetical protein
MFVVQGEASRAESLLACSSKMILPLTVVKIDGTQAKSALESRRDPVFKLGQPQLR